MKPESAYMFIGGGFLIIGLFVFFFGFSPKNQSPTPLEKTVTEIQSTQEQQTASAHLENKGEGVFALVIKNPKKENIQSVQLTIAYSPEIVFVKNLVVPETPILELTFAGKGFGIDEAKGLISITAGFAGKSGNIPEAFEVARFEATKKEKNTPAFFSFPKLPNAQSQQILIIKNNQLTNILNETLLKNFAL